MLCLERLRVIAGRSSEAEYIRAPVKKWKKIKLKFKIVCHLDNSRDISKFSNYIHFSKFPWHAIGYVDIKFYKMKYYWTIFNTLVALSVYECSV